ATPDAARGRPGEPWRRGAAPRRRNRPPWALRRRPPEPRPSPSPAAPVSAGRALSTTTAPPLARSRIEPISDEFHVLRITVSREFVADLEAAKAALSHQIPDGRLEKILHECLRRALRELGKRQVGSGARYVPAAVRKQVWSRDGGACSFEGTDGHRCGSRHQLQLHHLVPFAKGGPATVENLKLVCARHN